MATGRYIAFLDTDDFFLNNKLKKQIAFMDTNSLSFTYTSYEVFFPRSNRVFIRQPLQYFNYFRALVTRGIALSTVMIKNTEEWQDITKNIVSR